MQQVDFDKVVQDIVAKDPRYPRGAYHFVREALDFTQRSITQEGKHPARHICGQELNLGIKAFALQQFGPMAMTVLEDWGVHRCEDFGELVFNMIDCQLLSKTEKDRREDFAGGYDFFEAFRLPYLPESRKAAQASPAPESAKV